MHTNSLQELKYDTTRQIVVSTRGDELPIKEHNGWRFVNYKGVKVGISKLAKKFSINSFDDFMSEYITTDWHIMFPCIAMEYFIHRKISDKKISILEYKKIRKNG
jgi:hypothetical protein